MDLGMTERVKPLVEKVRRMVGEEIAPLDAEFHAEVGKGGDRFAYTPRMTEILEGLKAKAKERGLWNFWLTDSDKGHGLTTVEYAVAGGILVAGIVLAFAALGGNVKGIIDAITEMLPG